MSEANFSDLQHRLVETLKNNGSLSSAVVEQALLDVPRHLFLPEEPLDRVYSDIAIAVKRGEEGEWTSSSSQPAIMAIMLEQLDLRPGQRVLEIGAGTGFNAALMADIVGRQGRVTAIDIQPDLIEAARRHLGAAGFDWVETVIGDGGYGYPPGAPYDRIILTASSTVITPAWREQLAPGGRLVLPFNTGGGPQVSVAFEKRGEELVSTSLSDCGFMPLQGAFSTVQPVRTQIGPDPRLFAISDRPLSAAAEDLADWLNEARTDRALASGIQVAARETWGIFTWLAVHQIPWAQLIAEGELAGQVAIPPLLYYGHGEEWHSALTVLLAGPDGAGALSRPPGQPAPFNDWDNPSPRQAEPPFEIYVQPLGPNASAAQRLLKIVRDWNQAGKPTSARLHLRALSADVDYQPAADETVLERPWTKFIVRYQ